MTTILCFCSPFPGSIAMRIFCSGACIAVPESGRVERVFLPLTLRLRQWLREPAWTDLANGDIESP